MGSKGIDAGDPEQAKRFTFTSFMTKLGAHFASVSSHDELEVLVPANYRFMRVLLADAIEADPDVQDELGQIDEDEKFEAEANVRRWKATQDPRKIAQRERYYAKMEVLQRLAVRRGIWGREEIAPDSTAEEILEDQDLDQHYSAEDLEDLDLTPEELEAVDP